jgi:hypothetical protein
MIMTEEQDDVIPGIGDDSQGGDHDYTREDRQKVPFDTPDEKLIAQMLEEDLEIGGEGNELLEGVSARDIERGSFRQIAPGDYPKIQLLKFVPTEVKYTKVYVIGEDNKVRPSGYNTKQVRITFCIPDDPNCTVQDSFVIPPREKSERVAFETGFSDEQKAEAYARDGSSSGAKGFHSRKLKQFLCALGFGANENKAIHPDASSIWNWMHYADGSPRFVGMTVKVGDAPRTPKINEDTGQPVSVKIYNQPALFQYKFFNRDAPQKAAGRPAAASQPQPAAQPAATGKANGGGGRKRGGSKVQV